MRGTRFIGEYQTNENIQIDCLGTFTRDNYKIGLCKDEILYPQFMTQLTYLM